MNKDAHGIIIAGHYKMDDTYHTSRPHGMKDWLITFTLGGQGYFNTPDCKLLCTNGDVVLLKPGTPHQYGTVSGNEWNFVWAHFSAFDMDRRLLPTEQLTVQALESGSSRKRVYRAFNKVISDSRERREYWHALCLGALQEILMLLAQKRNDKLDPRIEEAIHYLSRNMRNAVRVDMVAKSIGVSSSRLSHLFKESTGYSIIDTLNRMRIQQAALLLQHTHRSTSDIAYDVGYHNYNHFINQFRKWLGVSPSEFKKSLP